MAVSALPARILTLLLVLVLLPSFGVPHGPVVRIAARPVQPGGLPPTITRVTLLEVGRDQARELNAAMPFASVRGPSARPFALAGDNASRERAVDCLASAMWYEAGGNPLDQSAVGQVVLNRVRHPAFPASVCGVVFQGSQLSTGCQFTFTCDGSLRRRPPEAALDRARALARAMLDGMVDDRVGLATHYHTDWVHPVWSAAMDKLARVDTHLFFRWRGAWGQASAMRQAYGTSEPNIPALAFLSSVHRKAGDEPGPETALALVETHTGAGLPAEFVAPTVAVSPGSSPLRLDVSLADGAAKPAMAALDLCGARAACKVIGSAEGAVAFVYVRDRRTGVELAFWDCAHFPRRNAGQCIGPATRRWIAFDGNLGTDVDPDPGTG